MSDWNEATVSNIPTWDREETVVGTLKKVQENIGPNESMLYTLKTKDGLVGVWGSSVLDSKFSDIEVGYEVKIEPLGEVKSPKTGRKYQDFKVMYRTPEDKIEEVGDEEVNLDEIFPE